MIDLKKLAQTAKDFTILYAEDNKKLRDNVAKLLNNFFTKVYLAENGKIALELFNNKHYDIVVTDVKMPNMDGMELAKNIRAINPDTKIIIMSAFDDREYLFSSIELKVFRYLKKPVNINDFTKIIYEVTQEIKEEQNTKIFNKNIESVFNYQSSLVIMLKGSEPIFANQMFLDFFEADSIENVFDYNKDIGKLFLEHDGFLYNTEDRNWFDEISQRKQELHNVKILDKDGALRHFILKYQKIPDKESYGILSFDDITELKLLKLYDSSQTKDDENMKNTKAMFDLLEVLHRNSAVVKVHNFYKGLSINNEAIISEIKDETITIKTKFLQQKAIHLEQRTVIISEALPYAIESSKIANLSFEKQTIELEELKFIQTSAVDRSTIRVVPDEKYTVSLFLGENKFHSDITIEDLSLEAIRINMYALPAGLDVDTDVHIDIVLELDNKPLIINTKVTLFKKIEHKNDFSLVFKFDDFKKGELTKYITKRQMAIIREFKGMQNG